MVLVILGPTFNLKSVIILIFANTGLKKFQHKVALYTDTELTHISPVIAKEFLHHTLPCLQSTLQ